MTYVLDGKSGLPTTDQLNQDKLLKFSKTKTRMTKSRRPTNFPLPNNPGQEGDDEDEEELEGLEEEESGDSEEEIGSEDDDSTGSAPPSPLTREIMIYEERNEELERRLREYEAEKRRQDDLNEIWRNAVALMEIKLKCLRDKVEEVEMSRMNQTATERESDDSTAEDLETIATIEKQLEDLRVLIRANDQGGSGLVHPPEIVSGEGSGLEVAERADETQASEMEITNHNGGQIPKDQGEHPRL